MQKLYTIYSEGRQPHESAVWTQSFHKQCLRATAHNLWLK